MPVGRRGLSLAQSALHLVVDRLDDVTRQRSLAGGSDASVGSSSRSRLRHPPLAEIECVGEVIGALRPAQLRCLDGKFQFWPALSEMVGAVILSRVIADAPLADLLIAAVVTDIAGAPEIAE
jgi:hypothetical protein